MYFKIYKEFYNLRFYFIFYFFCNHTFWFLYLGIDEVGIYRISAVTSEIQKIKKTFDKSKLLD